MNEIIVAVLFLPTCWAERADSIHCNSPATNSVREHLNVLYFQIRIGIKTLFEPAYFGPFKTQGGEADLSPSFFLFFLNSCREWLAQKWTHNKIRANLQFETHFRGLSHLVPNFDTIRKTTLRIYRQIVAAEKIMDSEGTASPFTEHLRKVDVDNLPNWCWWHRPAVVIAGIFGTTCFNLRAGEPSTTVRRRPFSAHPGVFFNLRLFKQNKNTAFLSAMPPTSWQKETQSNANIHAELNLRHYLRKRVLWTSNLVYIDSLVHMDKIVQER